VFGEDPYAEGNGDIDNLDFQRGDKKSLALLKTLKAQHIPVVSVFLSGRPLWVNAELNASDAFVAAWLPGTEGEGIADVLLRKANGEINYDFVGKLSYSWPATPEQTHVNRFDADYQPLLPYGYGLRYLESANQEQNRVQKQAQKQAQLSDNLPEQVSANAKNASVNILTRAVQKPWRVVLRANNQEKIVSSNVQTLGAVTLKTSDRNVQEDARHFIFNGTELASVGFESNFPRDLRSTVENNLALQFSYKVNQLVSKKVTKEATKQAKTSEQIQLAMQCQFPSEGNHKPCGASFDISEKLHQASLNKWQQMTIDMGCFQKLGVNMAKVTSPFTISSNAKLSIEVADIVIKKATDNNATLVCPK